MKPVEVSFEKRVFLLFMSSYHKLLNLLGSYYRFAEFAKKWYSSISL